jgi:threonine dehydratase
VSTNFSALAAARELLAKYLPRTRLIPAQSLRKSPEQNVCLKLESELPTGSFKVRGAIYALGVHEKGGRRGVVASSTGNHGAAVAYAAQLLGWQARIFLPEENNPVKRANIARLGAEIVEKGAVDLAGACEAASRYARETGAFFLNDASDPDLPAGPATIACEIFEQQPETEVIYVPMGDTALIRGVASAAKQISSTVKIIGVQAERAPSYFLSWKQGRAIETKTCDTIADGLATRTPVVANVTAIRKLVDDVILVSEGKMLDAIRKLLLDEHIVAEPAGAAATAAFLKARGNKRENVVLLVTGANVSREMLMKALKCS